MKRTVDNPRTASPAKKPRTEQDVQEKWRRPKATVWVEIPSRAARPRDVDVNRYSPVGDEVTESAEVRVTGETAPEEDEEDDEVPVRTLDDFAVFDPETREFVTFERLLVSNDMSDSRWVAAGTVGAFTEDSSDDSDSDDDSDDEGDDANDNVDGAEVADGAQRLLLSTVLECDAHWVSKHGRTFSIDSRIYLRTKYAWYILLRPSPSYRRFYTAAWNQHRIVQGLLSTLTQDSRSSLSDVLKAINTAPDEGHPTRPAFDALAEPVFDEDLTSDDLVSYLIHVLDRLQYDHSSLYHKLVHSKLMQSLYPTACARKPPTSPHRKPLKVSRDIEKEVLKHRNPTCVTPRVSAVAQKLFAQALRVADLSEEPADETPSANKARRVHAVDPTSMEWVEESMIRPGHYGSVLIDGVTYSAGDVVIVEPGHDQHSTRAKNARSQQAHCRENALADTKWFCKIAYMFEKRDSSGRRRKYFHARWLQHGSQTLLQEAAHPRMLMWLNECEDQPIECIYSLCNLEEWPVGAPSPSEDPTGDMNRFHVGLTWDSEHCSFAETPAEEVERALAKCEPGKECVSCGLAFLRDESESWSTLPDGNGVSRSGVDYHVHDFVYLHTPGLVVGLLSVAQIIEFIVDDMKGITHVKVRHYGRYDSVLAKHRDHDGPTHWDNRRLFQSEVYTSVKPACISGKAYVACPPSAREVEDFVKQDNHFYCDLQAESLSVQSLDDLERLSGGISQCDLCCTAVMEAALESDRLVWTHGRLRGLELFAGAGGLSTGLEMSGCVHTQWAVEFSPSAARTYKANHPGTIVYNQCTNKLLEHAIQRAKGYPPRPLKSLDDGEGELPPMPEPGDVDFIYGGPPCQSFSLMNHCRKADDIRSTLVCNMISYVEFYRPMYFLLENVVGMLSYRVGGQQHGNRVVGGISMGVVKFILASLTILGYQVHFRVLQAGQHGAPQGRRRVIFLGARRGVPLPDFPLPQYAFKSLVHNVHLSTGETLYPMTYMGADQDGHQCAPLPAVTVMEAISDLPRFDWIDPHIKKRATKQDLEEIGSRLAEGISRFSACKPSSHAPPPGYHHAVLYAQPPLSRYQSWVRAGNGSTVLYHYTSWCAPGVVERVVNVPIKPDAGHQDLPLQLRVPHLYDAVTGQPKKAYNTVYGRINGSGQFVTAMTTLAPNAKGGRVLHPDQKRILTIRECARAQGFPDSYKFLSVNKKTNDIVADQMRQIGNAVPVPLGLALGKEVGKALCRLWRHQEEQGLRERARSPEIPQ
ncbi:S-adenosyl-L-methionine-dependent methyltransferase [Pilatotrama ljubarskyi]|nr:S-adenosyl-L-methionine-dependent methyltransferase [Pilatotrama ljubarskyi]